MVAAVVILITGYTYVLVYHYNDIQAFCYGIIDMLKDYMQDKTKEFNISSKAYTAPSALISGSGSIETLALRIDSLDRKDRDCLNVLNIVNNPEVTIMSIRELPPKILEIVYYFNKDQNHSVGYLKIYLDDIVVSADNIHKVIINNNGAVLIKPYNTLENA